MTGNGVRRAVNRNESKLGLLAEADAERMKGNNEHKLELKSSNKQRTFARLQQVSQLLNN